MAPKTLSPRKQEILQQAQKLFSNKGFSAASMRDLAELISVKPASLYSHFDSKDQMLWEIASRCAHEFFETLTPIAAAHSAPVQKLQEMIYGHIAVMLRNADASAIFFKEWQHLSEPRRSAFAQQRTDYEQLFNTVLQEGIDQGVFKPTAIRFTTLTLLSGLNWVAKWYRPDGSMDLPAIQEQLTTILMGGITHHS